MFYQSNAFILYLTFVRYVRARIYQVIAAQYVSIHLHSSLRSGVMEMVAQRTIFDK